MSDYDVLDDEYDEAVDVDEDEDEEGSEGPRSRYEDDDDDDGLDLGDFEEED